MSKIKNRLGSIGVIAIICLLELVMSHLQAVEIGPMTWTPRSDWINVKSCSAITGGPNAVGDGVADDTAAIQSVFTYFGNNKYGRIRTAYFPPGTYKISSTLTLGDSSHAVSSIQVIGCGSDTTIVWAGASGSAMFHPSWSGYMRYIGIVWDGASIASCAYQHDCDATTGGSYETQIRHENESFKNFTVTGTYSFLSNKDVPTTGAPAAAIITGFPYGGTTADSEVYNCHFSNCTNGIICAYGITQVFEWQIDGCEFDNCGIAFNGGGGYCYMIDNTHFQGSTSSDVYAGANYRMRNCTSSGSHCFMNNVQGKMVLQDCWVDGWTNTLFAVNFVGAGESSVFDCTFTNPPAGASPPFYLMGYKGSCNLMMSNNYAPDFPGGLGIVTNDSGVPNYIDFVQPGLRGGLITSPTQTFLSSAEQDDSTHIIDVTKSPYTADPTFVTDSTATIQAAIDAAEDADDGSVVYIPPGLYKISSTLTATGGNYSIQGAGPVTQLCWYGDSDNTMMTIGTPQATAVQEIRFAALNNLPGTSGYSSSAPTCDPTTITGISETSTGASSITYDDFYFNSYQMGNPGAVGADPLAPGLVLDNLPVGSFVNLTKLNSPLTVQNCGAAQIFSKTLYSPEVNVSGTGAKTGFLGALNLEGIEQVDPDGYVVSVTDNQNLVIADHYTESDYNDVSLTCGAATTPGHVTIQGLNAASLGNSYALNVDNYAGRIYFGNYDMINGGSNPVQMIHAGTNPVDLILAGNLCFTGAPTITAGSGANLIETLNASEIHNSYPPTYAPDVPNPLTDANYLSIAASLDDMRQLEAVDWSVEFGIASDAPPVAAYPLEQNALDMTGNNNGTASGVTYVDGAVGSYAAGFNGTNSYIQIPKSVSTTCSIAMWVKTTDTGAAGQWWAGKGLVDGEMTGTTHDFGTALNAGKFSLGIGGPDTTVTSTVAINDGAWHHVVGTWNSSNGAMQVYVDGVLNNSGTGPTGPRSITTALRIGSIQTGIATGFLNGAIDQVRIYNYVLNATEVANLYARPHGQLPVTSGLVAHWKLDETTGTTSADTSGNGLNGTWENSPTFSATYPTLVCYPDPGSLSFNGTNQYVNAGNPSILPSGTAARTICGWAKAGSTAGWGWIASFGSPSVDGAMCIGMDGTTLDGGGYQDDLTVANFWDSNWHFIALTYDGTTAKLYADGVLKASAPKSWNLVHNACYIGEQVDNGSEYWNGNVDDVRIYNRALSAAEISQLAAGNP